MQRVGALFLVLALAAPAVADASENFQFQNARVQRVASGWGGEAIYVLLDNPVQSTCAVHRDSVVMEKGHPGYKENLAILLAAVATKAPVELWYDRAACYNGQARLVSIGLR
ncbi:MAG: hypothetical protein ACK5TK_02610 [Betaproteobacteria bacterium]